MHAVRIADRFELVRIGAPAAPAMLDEFQAEYRRREALAVLAGCQACGSIPAQWFGEELLCDRHRPPLERVTEAMRKLGIGAASLGESLSQFGEALQFVDRALGQIGGESRG